MSKSYVYFISNGDNIKIGKANNPLGRLKQLQTSSDSVLTILGVIECYSDSDALQFEARLHIYFSKQRLSGEWFNITEYDISALDLKLIDPPVISKSSYLTNPTESVEVTFCSTELSFIGKLTLWLLTKLTGNEYLIALRIGVSMLRDETLSYSELSKLTGISVRSVERIVPKLIASGFIIKVATNQISYAGKLPYKYQLNMKLAEFPSLGNLHSNRIDSPVTEPTPEPEFICPPVEDYFIQGSAIRLLSEDPERVELLTSRGLLEYPTVEQLTNHLKELICTTHQ